MQQQSFFSRTNLSALFDVLNSLAHFLFGISPFHLVVCSYSRIFAFSVSGTLRISHRWLPKCGTSFAFKMFSPAHFLPQLWLFIWHISLCLPIQRAQPLPQWVKWVAQCLFAFHSIPLLLLYFFFTAVKFIFWLFSAVRYFAVFGCVYCQLGLRLSISITDCDSDYDCLEQGQQVQAPSPAPSRNVDRL